MQKKKGGWGDNGDEEMETKSVSKLIFSSPHSPYSPFFIRDMTDCRRLKCYAFYNLHFSFHIALWKKPLDRAWEKRYDT